jgi:hypothetical protein
LLNSGGGLVSSSAGTAMTLAPGVWTAVSAPGVPPSGAVTASPRIAYVGTPAAADVTYVAYAAFIENLGGIAPPAAPPLILGGTSETANVAANTSTRRAWPVFTIAGPVTNPSVAYALAGRSVSLQTTLAPGQVATIDTRPWQRSVTRSDGGSLAGALRGNMLRDMSLPAGNTTIRYSGQDPTGTTRCTITWRAVSGSIGGST